MGLALLYMGLYTLCEVLAAVNAFHYIIERYMLLCGIDTFIGLLCGPDGERSQRADLPGYLKNLWKDLLFIEDSRQKSALQGLLCRE